jgi:thiol-disulfide isomerase/thioredoxin
LIFDILSRFSLFLPQRKKPMKKNILALLGLLSLISTSFAAGSSNAYDIRVKVKGLRDSSVFLANYYGDKQYIQDTAVIDKNGLLSFSGKKKLDGGMYLLVMGKKKLFDFMVLDNDQHFTLETDTLDYNAHMKVNGSPENTVFFEYLNWLSHKQKQAELYRARYKEIKESKKDSAKILEDILSGMDKEVKGYMNDFMKKHPASFTAKFLKATLDIEVPEAPTLPNGRKDSTFAYHYYKTHFFDNIDLADERMLRTPIYHPKIKQYLDNMVMPLADSIIKEGDMIINKATSNKETFKYCVFYMIYTYETSKVMGYDAVFVHEAFKYYKTGKAFWVTDAQKKKVVERASQLDSILIGKTAPNLVMQDSLVGLTPEFNTYSLKDIKARYTIVYFWDPDCGHCQKETPKLRDLYERIGKKYDIKIFGVGCISELPPWRKYIRVNKLMWINVIDAFNKNHYKHVYDIYSTPVIYILDEHKKIIAKRLDTEQIEEFLERYEKMMKMKK